MPKSPCVYIVTNRRQGTLYIGVTSSLVQRIWQHKQKVVGGFTARYNLSKLVWFETHESMESAILREKQLKAGSRIRKVKLIEEVNPEWRDLYENIVG
ncbi:putative endonuclease [Litorivivens lipolytica]|uniref:Putative endonuclease n=1 Tax=Litorivivens lipolytica TaxID=1524264 RepID=A0A7W4Z705_9GAMM|nr:GIY-YIG nuclease family protein [Litorivivens lipolytica]MBB3048798.1 putative endonuclease [Litorivivens lipolytica]